MSAMASSSLEDGVLPHILSALKQLQLDNAALKAAIDAIGVKVDTTGVVQNSRASQNMESTQISRAPNESPSTPPPTTSRAEPRQSGETSSSTSRRPSIFSSRIILTTYPGQSGIDPVPLAWGEQDPAARGPVVVARQQNTIRRRNGKRNRDIVESGCNGILAIGAHGGSYSIYHALAVASQNLPIDHKPDFTNTEPAANIGPFPTWAGKKKIVSMDPWGHLAPWLFKDFITQHDIEIRPTIAITKAHMKLPELEDSVRAGRLVPDGRICINSTGELAVTKVAVEPVWYLPGVAERFGIGKYTVD